MNARQIIEAIRFSSTGEPVFTIDRNDPNDIEDKNSPRHHPGEVRTHLRYDRSLGRRGTVDPYSRTRPVVDTQLVPVNVGGIERKMMTIAAYTHTDVTPENLTRLKQANWEGSEKMIDHAASYLAKAVEMHHFDGVVPVPSSKPLAKLLAQAIAGKLGTPIVDGLFSKVKSGVDSIQAKHMSTHSWQRFKTQKFARTSTPIDGNSYLLVDDISTTQSSLIELAGWLYKEGAEFVGAATLTLQQGTAQKAAKPTMGLVSR